jgi:hypothetical protein
MGLRTVAFGRILGEGVGAGAGNLLIALRLAPTAYIQKNEVSMDILNIPSKGREIFTSR